MSQGMNNRESVPLMFSESDSIYDDRAALMQTHVVTQQPETFLQDKLYKKSKLLSMLYL